MALPGAGKDLGRGPPPQIGAARLLSRRTVSLRIRSFPGSLSLSRQAVTRKFRTAAAYGPQPRASPSSAGCRSEHSRARLRGPFLEDGGRALWSHHLPEAPGVRLQRVHLGAQGAHRRSVHCSLHPHIAAHAPGAAQGQDGCLLRTPQRSVSDNGRIRPAPPEAAA